MTCLLERYSNPDSRAQGNAPGSHCPEVKLRAAVGQCTDPQRHVQDPDQPGRGVNAVSRLLERYFTPDSSAQAKAAVQRTLRANRRLSSLNTGTTDADGMTGPLLCCFPGARARQNIHRQPTAKVLVIHAPGMAFRRDPDHCVLHAVPHNTHTVRPCAHIRMRLA